MPDVVIVGGGITGLTAAYRLRQSAPQLNITLAESSSHLGGKIRTDRGDGFVLEWGPDCFLSRKTGGLQLCRDLGIATELVGRDPRYAQTFVLRHGRLHQLPEGLTGMIPTNLEALTGSTLLSAAARERLAQERTLPPAPDNGDESLAHFVSRRLGPETFENLVEPLMGGIYAGQADQLSLAATFPQLRRLEQTHGSLLTGLTSRPAASKQAAYPPFVSFPTGMQTLVEALTTALTGVQILLETAVTALEKTADGYQLQLSNKQPLHAKTVILTTPAPVSSQLLADIDSRLAGTLAEIPYASTALVNLAYKENDVPPLNGYGYVIPRVEERAALACTWTSRKWENRAPAGTVLLRVYIGRYGQADVTAYDDGRLLAIAQQELQETVNINAKPLWQRIVRYPLAMPQYNLGHLDRVARIEERLQDLPGLFMAGAAFRGLGIPDCITGGETAAAEAGNILVQSGENS